MVSVLNAPLEAPTLADRAYEKLVDAIVRGELAPGARLSEVTLARRLGISRGPLREAIGRLEGRKLVTRMPRVGARVVSLSRADLEEIFQVREALEGMACRLACERMREAELDELEFVLEGHQQNEELQTGSGYFQAAGDYDFHFRIAKGSGNQRLVQLLCGDLYELLRVYRYRSSVARGRARRAFAEHREILRAMRDRDGASAERLMRAHIAAAIANLPKEEESAP